MCAKQKSPRQSVGREPPPAHIRTRRRASSHGRKCRCCRSCTLELLPLLHPRHARGAPADLPTKRFQPCEGTRIDVAGDGWAARPSTFGCSQFARTHASLSKSRNWAAQSSFMSFPDPLVRANPSANPPRVYDFTPTPNPKPSPPVLRKENPRGDISYTVAEPISPSSSFSLWPSDSVTMKFSESAAPPSQEVSAIQPKRGPPYDRIRTFEYAVPRTTLGVSDGSRSCEKRRSSRKRSGSPTTPGSARRWHQPQTAWRSPSICS